MVSVFENSLCLNFKSENGVCVRMRMCSVLQNALLVCSPIDHQLIHHLMTLKYLTLWSARTWRDLPVVWNHRGVYSFMLYPGTTGIFSALESAVP